MKQSNELCMELLIYRAVPYLTVQVVRRYPLVGIGLIVTGAIIEINRIRKKKNSLLVRFIQ
ncbi:hypothetical protein [Bacteriovorax sp. BSW11_IV]|uniref:hypothetical protein n=1 Tax=Bacteriovorax sp. BSW11_IV TaxID=1353529 RepID=UPI0012DDD65B|nr:hypothetical protein [Bacteriovorax sp. BSW11_IV]